MSLNSAWIAADRFGYGAKPKELKRIASNPKAWLRKQLTADSMALEDLAHLPPTAGLMARVMEANRVGDERLMQRTRKSKRQASKREALLRTLNAVNSEAPFRERLVHFWSNHLTVSAKRTSVAPIAGAFEREVIRPNLNGTFEDLLLAAVRHPAMLLYLDNISSVGPNSMLGRRRRRGLNENLAREILELHTLGVDGGYGQAGVRALAKLLTGWSVARLDDGRPGTFWFRKRAHEPGPKTLLGRRFDGNGIADGEQALAMLAHHPATARHIATKLARHFVSDAPPRALVGRLARRFRETNGGLAPVMHELIDCRDAWHPEPRKIKSPNDLVISTFRLLGTTGFPEDAMARSLEFLGQVPFHAPSPAGWPDVADEWIGPESLMARLGWAHFIAEHARTDGTLLDVLARRTRLATFSVATRREIARAESGHEALALFLASPEFQRR